MQDCDFSSAICTGEITFCTKPLIWWRLSEWTIKTVTGSGSGMATENEVTIVFYGEDGVSEPYILGSGEMEGYFKAEAEDTFKVRVKVNVWWIWVTQ